LFRYTIILFFLVSQFSILAQLEVYTYPINFKENTTLNYSIDYLDNESIENTGVHLEWDLTNSETPIYEQVEIVKNQRKVNNTKINHEIIESGNTTFFRKFRRNFDEIGFLLFPNSNHSHIVVYDNPIKFSTTKLIYGATFSNSTTFNTIIERNEIPKEILINLPKSVQKIKIVGDIHRNYHCDADGKFIFNDKTISSLRIKVDEKISIRLYDILSGNEIPNISNKVLKKVYNKIGGRTYFLFFSNSTKYYFAKAEFSNISNSFIIKYQSDIDINYGYSINSDKKVFLIYPNPTYNTAKILISNFKTGNYTIELYNIIGRKLWSENITLSKKNMLKYNFSFLRKGTYLIALKDRFGKVIQTKKIMIISI